MRLVLHPTLCTYRQPLPTFPRSLQLHIGMCSRRSSNGLILPAYAQFHPSCCWTKIAPPVPSCNSPFYVHSRLLCNEHYLSEDGGVRRPDQLLHCEQGAFPTAHGRLDRSEARGGWEATGWRVNTNCRSTTLSASWEAVMSGVGEIDCFHEDGFLGLLSPLPS